MRKTIITALLLLNGRFYPVFHHIENLNSRIIQKGSGFFPDIIKFFFSLVFTLA